MWELFHCTTSVLWFLCLKTTGSNIRKHPFPLAKALSRLLKEKGQSTRPQDSIKILARPATKDWPDRYKIT